MASAAAAFGIACGPPPPGPSGSDPGAACSDPVVSEVRSAVADARIVVLGEPTHGDGAAFRFRNDLVRCLHEASGFDLIALESGFAQMEAVDSAVAAGAPPADAAEFGVLSLWRESAEMMDLLAWVGRTRATARPVRLAGFDLQNTAADRGRWRDRILAPLRGRLGFDDLLDRIADDHERFFGGRADEATHRRLLDDLAALGVSLDRAPPGAVDDPELRRRALDDLAGQVSLFLDFRFENPRPFTVADNNPRDARMADNLGWLLSERFPDRKAVVLMASLHALHRPEGVADEDGEPALPGFVSTGARLHDRSGAEVYTIGFSAATGRWGLGRGEGARGDTIAPAPADALESTSLAPGRDRVFVDFRRLAEDHPARAERTALFLGYEPRRAVWPEQLDGAVVFRVMEPAAPVGAGG